MGGPIFQDNSGEGRWGSSRGALGGQGARDDSAKTGVSREGVHIQMSCPNCSLIMVADDGESKFYGEHDPDDLRFEAVCISWDEIKGMLERKINTPRLRQTPTGYMLVEVCPRCSKHYVQERGLPIDPKGLPPEAAKAALQRRAEVSASRPLSQTALMRWYQTGQRAKLVR